MTRKKIEFEKDAGDDVMVAMSVRVPRELRDAVDQAAAAWKVKASAIIRKAVEDGMISWQHPDLGQEALERLERIEKLALACAVLLNLEHEGKMKDEWKDRFGHKKLALQQAASVS